MPSQSPGFAACEQLLAVCGVTGDSDVVALLSVASPAPSAPQRLRHLERWAHAGPVTELHVASYGNSGALALLAGSAHGAVTRVRLQMPSSAASPDGAVVLDDDGSGACPAWLQMGALAGEVSSLDSETATHEVLVATTGGTLACVALTSGGGGKEALSVLHESRFSAFAAARWAARGTALTVGAAPGLTVWDARARPSDAGTARAGGAGSRSRYGCLAVDPAQPSLVAAGDADAASVCLWDLRKGATPLAVLSLAVPPAGGPTWCVAFDQGACFSAAPSPGSVLACTASGMLFSAAPNAPPRLLASEAAAVSHLALEPSAFAQLVAVTDAECLLLWDATRGEEEQDNMAP